MRHPTLSNQPTPHGVVWPWCIPRPRLGPVALLCLLVLLFAVAGEIAAQPHRLSTPADSYLWWPLSDDITPAELKALWSDRALSLERYDEAVKAGLEGPLDPEKRPLLKYYINIKLTPELGPMWLAFDIFARERISRTGVSPDVVPAELADYGISPGGVETIMVAAHGCVADHDALMFDLGPKQIEAQLLIQDRRKAERAGTAPPGKPIMEAVNERRYDLVASVTDRPVGEIRELVDALADWDAPSRLMAECLPALKLQLTDADWQRFQAFLREVVIQPFGGLPFFDKATRKGILAAGEQLLACSSRSHHRRPLQ